MTRLTSPAAERLVAAAAVVAGLAAWTIAFQAGLTLSHYDAKAHLVVARRVVDNLTPGWQQIGAVWLPLPHLINLLPTQIDLFYRTGAFASCVSVACFGVTAWAAARLIGLATGSALGAFTSGALLVSNVNLLYIHTTPMTEPLLLAVTFTMVLWLYEWVEQGAGPLPRRLSVVLFAATWTRYEAWCVLAVAVSAAVVAVWRRQSWHDARIAAMRLFVWPAVAAGLFLLNSRLTVGSWFVSDGFFVHDPFYDGNAFRALAAVWWGTHRLSGYVVESFAILAAVWMAWLARRRGRSALLIPLSLAAAGALPFVAFLDGHPFRIRYMLPTTAACALCAGTGVGLVDRRGGVEPAELTGHRPVPRAAVFLAIALVVSLLIEAPLSGARSPLLEEAQWDLPDSQGRATVTACLVPRYRAGDKVLASMGSLAHYMQELASSGFDIADFIHEGNGTIWHAALDTGPAPHARWMLVEEEAEGGDVLAQRIRKDAAFAAGMVRRCEGGGVALYEREP